MANRSESVPLVPPHLDLHRVLNRGFEVTYALAYRAYLLYHCIVSPASNWRTGDPPGDLERAVADHCRECYELYDTIRQHTEIDSLYPPGGIRGWDRDAPCAVRVVLAFSARVLTQAKRLRGEPIAEEFGVPPFEQLPPVRRGWLTTLVEQEFAELRRRLPPSPGRADLAAMENTSMGTPAPSAVSAAAQPIIDFCDLTREIHLWEGARREDLFRHGTAAPDVRARREEHLARLHELQIPAVQAGELAHGRGLDVIDLTRKVIECVGSLQGWESAWRQRYANWRVEQSMMGK